MKPQTKKVVKLSMFTLAMMNIVAVVSLRGLPAEAEYGVSSAFYYILAAVIFLIPVSLVAGELGSMFVNKQGGMFRWVGEAFGARWGFLSMFMQWIESTIWYPTVLTFGAVSIAFIGMDYVGDSHLAANRWYTFFVVLGIYWLATFISFKGLKWVGRVSKIGGLVGTVIPAGILVIMAIIYLSMGGTSQMDWHGSFIPDFSKFDNIILAVSIFLFYAGMEMSGLHIKDVKDAPKNYPRAIYVGAGVTVLIFILATYALGVIIPAKDINLVQSLLVGFDKYFTVFHIKWFSPIMAIAITFGVLAGVLTWVAGPSKGILAVGKAGYLPKFFQHTNGNNVQTHILWVQGGIMSLLSLLIIIMPSVESFYQILSQLTVILYLIMYLFMFAAAIRLRYSYKDCPRTFRIGKSGNGLMWVVAGVGFLGALMAFIFSFFPPGQITMGGPAVWFSVLILGVVIFVAIPLIIYACRKPTWLDPQTDFEPFHWETAAEIAQDEAEHEAALRRAGLAAAATPAASVPKASAAPAAAAAPKAAPATPPKAPDAK